MVEVCICLLFEFETSVRQDFPFTAPLVERVELQIMPWVKRMLVKCDEFASVSA